MALRFNPRLIVLVFVILGCASPCWGQTTQQMPTPSPQHQRMGYFAGDWKLDGTVKISPNAPGGPFTSTEHGEWCRADSSSRLTPPCILSWAMSAA